MKFNKKLLLLAGAASVVSIGGIIAFSILASQGKAEETKKTETTELRSIDKELGEKHPIYRAAYLGGVRADIVPSFTTANFNLYGLTPYIGKNLIVNVYEKTNDSDNKLGQLVAYVSNVKPTEWMQTVSLGEKALKENTDYIVKVFNLDSEIFASEFKTNLKPAINVTQPSQEKPGSLRVTRLDSFINDENVKLFLSFTELGSGANLDKFVVPLTFSDALNKSSTTVSLENLLKFNNKQYSFQLIATKSDTTAVVYQSTQAQVITTIAGKTPEYFVRNSSLQTPNLNTTNPLEISFENLPDSANGKYLKVRYRIATPNKDATWTSDSDVLTNSDAVTSNKGKVSFTPKDSSTLTYEFQLELVDSSTGTATFADDKLVAFGTTAKKTFDVTYDFSYSVSPISVSPNNVLLEFKNFGPLVGLEYELNVFSYEDTTFSLPSEQANRIVQIPYFTRLLSGLRPNTLYNYTIKAKNATSALFFGSFTTQKQLSNVSLSSEVSKNVATLKFTGGNLYLKQNLLLSYRPVKGDAFTTVKIEDLKTNDFQETLTGLEKDTQYYWKLELVNEGNPNLELLNGFFQTTSEVKVEKNVFGTKAQFLFTDTLKSFNNVKVNATENRLLPNYIYIKYWTEQIDYEILENKSVTLPKIIAVTMPATESGALISETLTDLKKNTDYKYEIYTVEFGATKVLESGQFRTTSDPQLEVVSSGDGEAVLKITNLNGFQGQELSLELTTDPFIGGDIPYVDRLEVAPFTVSGNEHEVKLKNVFGNIPYTISLVKKNAENVVAYKNLTDAFLEVPVQVVSEIYSLTPNITKDFSRVLDLETQYNLVDPSAAVKKLSLNSSARVLLGTSRDKWNQEYTIEYRETDDTSSTKFTKATKVNGKGIAEFDLVNLKPNTNYTYKILDNLSTLILSDQSFTTPGEKSLNHSLEWTSARNAKMTFENLKGLEGSVLLLAVRPVSSLEDAKLKQDWDTAKSGFFEATLASTSTAVAVPPVLRTTGLVKEDGTVKFDVNLANYKNNSFFQYALLAFNGAGEGIVEPTSESAIIAGFIEKVYLANAENAINFGDETRVKYTLEAQVNKEAAKNLINFTFTNLGNYTKDHSKLELLYTPEAAFEIHPDFKYWAKASDVVFNPVENKLSVKVNNLDSNQTYRFTLLDKTTNEVIYQTAQKLNTNTDEKAKLEFVANANNSFAVKVSGLTAPATGATNPLENLTINFYDNAEHTGSAKATNSKTLKLDEFVNLELSSGSELTANKKYWYSLTISGTEYKGTLTTTAKVKIAKSLVSTKSAVLEVQNVSRELLKGYENPKLKLVFAKDSGYSSDKKEYILNPLLGEQFSNVHVTLSDLGAEQEYHVKLVLEHGTTQTEVAITDASTSFTTLKAASTSPTLFTNSKAATIVLSDISENDFKDAVVVFGTEFDFSNKLPAAQTSFKENATAGKKDFLVLFGELQPNTFYQYKVLNSAGTKVLDEGSFTTKFQNPEAKLGKITNNEVVVNLSKLNSWKNYKVTVQYRELPNTPTTANSTITWSKNEVTVGDLASQVVRLKGLNASKNYVVKAFIENIHDKNQSVELLPETNITTLAAAPEVVENVSNHYTTIKTNFKKDEEFVLGTLEEFGWPSEEEAWKEPLKVALQQVEFSAGDKSPLFNGWINTNTNINRRWWAETATYGTKKLQLRLAVQTFDLTIYSFILEFWVKDGLVMTKLTKAQKDITKTLKNFAGLFHPSTDNVYDTANPNSSSLPEEEVGAPFFELNRSDAFNFNKGLQISGIRMRYYNPNSARGARTGDNKLVLDSYKQEEKNVRSFSLLDKYGMDVDLTSGTTDWGAEFLTPYSEVEVAKMINGKAFVGQKPMFIGDITSSSIYSLNDLSIYSLEDFKDIITNAEKNPSLALSIISGANNKVTTYTRENLKVFVANAEANNAPGFNVHFVWKDENKFNSITLFVSMLNGMITISQNPNSLSRSVVAGETLASLNSYEAFAATATAHGIKQSEKDLGFAINKLDFGRWANEVTNNLEIRKATTPALQMSKETDGKMKFNVLGWEAGEYIAIYQKYADSAGNEEFSQEMIVNFSVTDKPEKLESVELPSLENNKKYTLLILKKGKDSNFHYYQEFENK
ncbi:hypothetical protein ACW95P_00260 [Candidatus Mycoplasma pogonae]